MAVAKTGLSKTLFKPEEFENAGYAKLFDNDDMTAIIPKISSSTTVIVVSSNSTGVLRYIVSLLEVTHHWAILLSRLRFFTAIDFSSQMESGGKETKLRPIAERVTDVLTILTSCDVIFKPSIKV